MFNDKYEEASYKERIFFRNLRQLYNLFPEQDWYITETDYQGKDVYDYLIQSKTSSYKRYIIEIKIRSDIHPDWIYESKKHRDLTEIKNIDPQNNTIIYINSTPEGTYIWNIDAIINKYTTEKKEMNASTMRSKKEKEDKKTYLLKAEDAKHYTYRWDEKQFHQHLESKKIEEIKTKKRLESDKQTLFDILFNNKK